MNILDDEYELFKHKFANLTAEDVKNLMLDYPKPIFKTFSEYLIFERHLTDYFKAK